MRCELGGDYKRRGLSRSRVALRKILAARKYRRAAFGSYRKFKQNLRGNLGGNENFSRF